MGYVVDVVPLLIGYAAGAIPFSYLIARHFVGIDLRNTESATMTASNVFRVGGFKVSFAAGILELVKGLAGPGAGILLGSGPLVVALAGGLAVVAHNWSPFGIGGGRGLATATGALSLVAWPAAVILVVAFLIGAAVRHIFIALGIGLTILVPVIFLVQGAEHAAGAGVVLIPIGWKTAAVKWRTRRSRNSIEGRADTA